MTKRTGCCILTMVALVLAIVGSAWGGFSIEGPLPRGFYLENHANLGELLVFPPEAVMTEGTAQYLPLESGLSTLYQAQLDLERGGYALVVNEQSQTIQVSANTSLAWARSIWLWTWKNGNNPGDPYPNSIGEHYRVVYLDLPAPWGKVEVAAEGVITPRGVEFFKTLIVLCNGQRFYDARADGFYIMPKNLEYLLKERGSGDSWSDKDNHPATFFSEAESLWEAIYKALPKP